MAEDFWRSDLAAECDCEQDRRGVGVAEGEAGGCGILRVQIRTEEAARRMGKAMGHYVTVDCGPICRLEGGDAERVGRVLGVELRSMAERLCGGRITEGLSVLTVGLGNRASTADAVGPETLRHLAVTRHLHRPDGAMFSTAGLCRISAIEPGVPAQTGLETAETVKGVVAVTHPDLVLAVDALTARTAERLGAAVQLSDGGLRPASGVGRGHCALDRETLGVPVIALGVPTAMRSEALLRVVEGEREGRRHLVTLAEVDLLVRCAGLLLADAIHRAFSIS